MRASPALSLQSKFGRVFVLFKMLYNKDDMARDKILIVIFVIMLLGGGGFWVGN